MKITEKLIQELIKEVPLLYSKKLDYWLTVDEVYQLEWQQMVLLESSSDRRLGRQEQKELKFLTEQLKCKDWIKLTILDYAEYCEAVFCDETNPNNLEYPIQNEGSP